MLAEHANTAQPPGVADPMSVGAAFNHRVAQRRGMDRGGVGRRASHGVSERRRRKVAEMPRGASPKRERQYEHIKASAEQRGEGTKRAEEIAARTVNKERARSGEAKTASRTSTRDISSSRRGGLRSHSGAADPTYEQLYAEARRRNIKGRSSMNKAQLARALGG
jgi:hypothetical protein